MRPEESLIGQPVRSLQTMLRVIEEAEHQSIVLIPDGIYSRQTAAAVADFQRNHGLPATGTTDQETWDQIVSAYENAEVMVGSAQDVEVVLNSDQCFREGDESPWIMLAQCMLSTLAGYYHFGNPMPVTGNMDAATGRCCKVFQKLCSLPETGNIDRMTWKNLSLQFTLAANSMGKS